jgi:hypothetical protein
VPKIVHLCAKDRAPLRVAVDQAHGKLWVGVNGTWLNAGNPVTTDLDPDEDYYPAIIIASFSEMRLRTDASEYSYSMPNSLLE